MGATIEACAGEADHQGRQRMRAVGLLSQSMPLCSSSQVKVEALKKLCRFPKASRTANRKLPNETICKRPDWGQLGRLMSSIAAISLHAV